MLSEAGKRWLKRAASTESNSYLAAELWYLFFEETRPYPWKRIKEHWKLFEEA